MDTVRFYEREGLFVQPVRRTSGGRRRYDADEVAWLGFCTRLRASGMPLPDIRRYAALVAQGPGNETERLELLRHHEKRIADDIATLSGCLDLIQNKVALYEQYPAADADDPCWTAGVPSCEVTAPAPTTVLGRARAV